MPLLNLLPWCRLEREYHVGELALRPYSPGDPLPGVDDPVLVGHVKAIAQCYRDIDGKTFGRCAVATLGDGSALRDFSADEEETLSELVTLACFASLAYRDLASAGSHYSNSMRFALYRHHFERAGDFTSLVYRRRDGQVRDGRYLPELRFTAPLETSSRTNVLLDEPLARGLTTFRDSASERDWGRLFNALTWFNFANSDSETVSEQMEWVALVSALEEVLDSQPNASAFAAAISSSLRPREQILASTSERNKGEWGTSAHPLRHHWAYEVYSVRGQFAHGGVTARGQDSWGRTEHLTLASIAFPLLVKQLLQRRGAHALETSDKAAIRGFEQLLNSRLLRGADPMGDDQRSVWDRIITSEIFALAYEAVLEQLPDQQQAQEDGGKTERGGGHGGLQ